MGGVDRGDQLHGYYNYKISCKMNDDTGQFKISGIVNQLLDKTKHLLEKVQKFKYTRNLNGQQRKFIDMLNLKMFPHLWTTKNLQDSPYQLHNWSF